MKHSSVSELGLVRISNQDRVLVESFGHAFLAVVCDGIGGGQAGDVASELTVNTFREAFAKKPDLSSDFSKIQWFKNTLDIANQNVFEKSLESVDYKGMGTTIVALVIYKKRAIGFNVGDSRLYEYRHSKLKLLSHDQTYAYQMYLQNEITKEEVEVHPRKNVLINAVGIKNSIQFETIRVVDGWQKLMLSTDGLHDFVPHAMVEQSFSLSLEKSSVLLKKLALEAGGYDNISFILIEDDGND